MLGLMLSGCGQSPPARKPTDPVPAKTAAAPAQTEDYGSSEKQTSTAAVAPARSAALESLASEFGDAVYLGDDVVAIAIVHPRRLSEWPLYRLADRTGMLNEIAHGNRSFVGIKPEEIERATVIIDQQMVNLTLENAGLTEPNSSAFKQKKLRNQLKQVGLAFHQYHDVSSGFPRHDSDADGNHVGLSWRVHLLPYLDQKALYDEFHLEEAWDSEHNKSLIEKMPAEFGSPGVSDIGKSAIHVFVGKGTALDAEKGSVRDFTDGTSNTILAIVAGADTADV